MIAKEASACIHLSRMQRRHFFFQEKAIITLQIISYVGYKKLKTFKQNNYLCIISGFPPSNNY